MFGKGKQWLKDHPKLVMAIGVAATAAAAWYGVPPEYSAPVLDKICDVMALCPRV